MDAHRRKVLQMALAGAGALALGPLFWRSGLPRNGLGSGHALNGFAFDAFDTMRHLARHSAQGLNFAPWLASKAFAQPARTPADVCVVTVRVMNLIHTPLCLKLGKIANPQTGAIASFKGSTDNYDKARDWDSRLRGPNDAKAHLLAKGLDRVHTSPRFQALRLNGWFGEMLATGRNDSDALSNGLTTADVGPFPPENEVALQTVLGINQNDTALNHSFKNTGFLPLAAQLPRGGDLNHHLAATGLVTSPLGIVCLNMGKAVESTDGDGSQSNKVIGSDLVTRVASGKKVSEYVTLLQQIASEGFVDDTLVAKLDGLGGVDARVPEQLARFRSRLASVSAQSRAAGSLEQMLHMQNLPNVANLQHINNEINQPARSEFLAQCRFVQAALDMEGKPFRNFSLLLNTSDVDNAPFNLAGAASGPLVEAVSLVEGMRQLAIGMNMLAQAIKKHRNVYVVVYSEGGRGTNGGDNKASHAFIMGPGGPGGLKDALYGNRQAIESEEDPHVIEPNEGGANAVNSPGLTARGAGLRAPDGNVLLAESGLPVASDQKMLNLASVLHGLVRHIESTQGAQPTTAGFGPRLVLQNF